MYIEDKLKMHETPCLQQYTPEQLASFEAIEDAAIDDCTLISSKFDKLCIKYTPYSLFNTIKQKSKRVIKEEKVNKKDGG